MITVSVKLSFFFFFAKQNKKRENKRKRKQERQCSLIVLLLLKDSQGQFSLAEHLIISLNLALTVERFLRMLSYNPVWKILIFIRFAKESC